MQFFYLHGFASSPRSKKAQDLHDRFAARGISLTIPDLNQDDFSHLTLTRQIQQVAALLPPEPASVTLIGSSFGGLTAAWLGDRHSQVQRLILLAPAFEFLPHWLARLGEAQVAHWQKMGELAVYHYGENRMLPLHYGFVEDAVRYSEASLRRPVPTLILHGNHDEVIPVEASRRYARDRPWVTLSELDSDHALTDVSEPIWERIVSFLELPTLG